MPLLIYEATLNDWIVYDVYNTQVSFIYSDIFNILCNLFFLALSFYHEILKSAILTRSEYIFNRI